MSAPQKVNKDEIICAAIVQKYNLDAVTSDKPHCLMAIFAHGLESAINTCFRVVGEPETAIKMLTTQARALFALF